MRVSVQILLGGSVLKAEEISRFNWCSFEYKRFKFAFLVDWNLFKGIQLEILPLRN